MIKNIGPLERKILDILWKKKEATAREICNILEKNGERRAYSTVRTIINRLVKKKIIAQRIDPEERVYIYLPLIAKNDLEKNWAVIAEAIQTILRREGYPKPYEALKELTRTNAVIDKVSISEFIESLNVADAVKEELRKIRPDNYTGVYDF